ncbi:tryptophan synthase beta subunit-like PLP-dependent enzyme [Clathrospora elynae]|uniref:Tryptophan synthase beta subunit-like PLP-dependent enzyme n=1 Tax=Clathrospora elynae TaxID=706981 RepID=A0A6A5T2K3_9PLEO|nr:tryptophan synthase beta subunit-like PLP-dependent enzyme [Clathrospora elynae]
MVLYTLPSLYDVEQAARLIADKVVETPVLTSQRLNGIATANLRGGGGGGGEGGEVKVELFFKCENVQKTGSFKFRGATHFLARLRDEELERGVVAFSTGNYAQAVAHAAQVAAFERGIRIPTSVVVPSNCGRRKVEAAESYGATVFRSGTKPLDRVDMAIRIVEETGAILVPPADDSDIVVGQATAVRELLLQVAGHRLDAVVVPSGGGGLLVGAIAVCKPLGVTVFAAEPELGGPGLAAAMQTGHLALRSLCLDGGSTPTIADGLQCLTGEANWEHIRGAGNVAQVFSVSEKQIKGTLRLVNSDEFVGAVEPSAAVGVAVVLFSSAFARWVVAQSKGVVRIGVVVTGGDFGVEELLILL